MAPCCPLDCLSPSAWHSRLLVVSGVLSPGPGFSLVELPAGAVVILSSQPLHKLFVHLYYPLSFSPSHFPPPSLAVSYSVFGVQVRCHLFGKSPLTPGGVWVPPLPWGYVCLCLGSPFQTVQQGTTVGERLNLGSGSSLGPLWSGTGLSRIRAGSDGGSQAYRPRGAPVKWAEGNQIQRQEHRGWDASLSKGPNARVEWGTWKVLGNWGRRGR